MDIIALSIPIFLALLIIEAAWDAFKHKGLYNLGDSMANLGSGILDQGTGLFVNVLTFGAFLAVGAWADTWRPWTMPSGVATWVACFIAADFCYYWAHRWSHMVNLLWTGHVVHHQSENYNLSVALRQSSISKMLVFWVYWPLALVGFSGETFLAVMALNLVYQFWIHTELIEKMGPFELVFNTPSHHRVHHGRNPKYIDRNHAGVFIIWDRMFGTFKQEEERPQYGITTPLESFNPVRAQVEPMWRLLTEAARMPGLLNKFRLLFAPPGWQPTSLGGFVPAPDIDPAHITFNPPRPRGTRYMLLARWIIVLAVSFSMLKSAPTLSMSAMGGIFLWVVLSLGLIGSSYDKGLNRWRFVGLLATDVALPWMPITTDAWLPGIIAGTALAIWTCYRLRLDALDTSDTSDTSSKR
jgi:alkylglycerol monooxygenase